MISVGRSSKHGMPPTKVAAGSVVQWDIRAQEHDIGLHIIFVPEGATQSSPDVVLVQEFVRVKNETNAFRAPCAGTLLVTLDNTYSMLRGKHVAFAMTAFAADDPAAAAIPTALNFSSVASTNEAATVGVRMFFSNDFDGAERFFARQRNRLPVFALGHATLAFLRAMMTMAEADMALATTRLEHALKLSQRIMPESKWFGSAAPMTNVQLDASVVHAECKLLMSALLLLTDQGKFTGLIKSALLFRGAWKLYESCDAVLGHTVTSISGGDGSFGMRAGAARELGAVEDAVLGEDSMLEGTPVIPTDDEDADMVLASSAAAAAGAPVHAPATTVSARAEGVSPALEGILFGIGSFNLLLSILPPLILKLVSAFGFPHSRAVGIEQLTRCFGANGVRSALSALVLAGLHVILPWAHPQPHIEAADAIMVSASAQYPNAALFLWVGGRLQRLKRNLPQAIESFQRCQAAIAATDWVQLAHLNDYEIGWAHMFQLSYERALPLWLKLQEENAWSKAFYCYMAAVCLVELGRHAEARTKFAELSGLITRKIAGKLIPPEQFVSRRAAEFLAHPADTQATALVLPALEHSYFFHGMQQMGRLELARALAECDRFLGLAVVEGDLEGATAITRADADVTAALNAAVASKAAFALAVDRVATCALIQGSIFKNLGAFGPACACYEWIIAHDKRITRERHCAPYAMHDLGLMLALGGGERKAAGMDLLKRCISVKEDHNYKLRLHTVTHLATSDMETKA